MTRIDEKPYETYPWYVRLLWRFQKSKYGKILKSTKIWARSPKVFMGLSAFYGALDRKSSPIHPQLRSLIILKVSEINNCSYCLDLNSAIARKRGVSKDKIMSIKTYQTNNLFSEGEKAALAYAESITYTEQKVTDELFQVLKKHYSEDEIVEITALIAFQNCSTKFNTALDIPSQGLFSRMK